MTLSGDTLHIIPDREVVHAMSCCQVWLKVRLGVIVYIPIAYEQARSAAARYELWSGFCAALPQ